MCVCMCAMRMQFVYLLFCIAADIRFLFITFTALSACYFIVVVVVVVVKHIITYCCYLLHLINFLLHISNKFWYIQHWQEGK